MEFKPKGWQRHFLNMSKKRKYMAMVWCRRSGKTFTAMQLIRDRMKSKSYFTAVIFNDPDAMDMLKQIIHFAEEDHRVVYHTDKMLVLDNGSVAMVVPCLIKADLIYINNFHTLPDKIVEEIVGMRDSGALNEILISGGGHKLEDLTAELTTIYVDYVNWRHIANDLDQFFGTTQDYVQWKEEMISKIGAEEFDKNFENKDEKDEDEEENGD